MSGRAVRRLGSIVALLLLPAAAIAEVSVVRDSDGKFKRHLFITRSRGQALRPVVWGQVRGFLPLEVLLNPLGDVRGDLPPRIAAHPKTGYPWVVWSMNEGNQKRIAYSIWDGNAWSVPAPVVAIVDPMGYDQLDPVLVFDRAGTPFLLWWVDGQVNQIFFSTFNSGRWTPPLLLSEEAVDSQQPFPRILRSSLTVTYRTPSGRERLSLDVATLLATASSLMDSPIPPGQTPVEGGGEEEERFFKRK